MAIVFILQKQPLVFMHKRTIENYMNRRKTFFIRLYLSAHNPLLGVHIKLIDHQSPVIGQMNNDRLVWRRLAKSESGGDLLNLVLIDLVVKGRLVFLEDVALLT